MSAIDNPRMKEFSAGIFRTISAIWSTVRCEADGDPQHLAEHRHADLHAHTGKKSDEYGPRQKIGQETQFEKPCHQQQASGEQRDDADQRHVLRGARRRHAR